MPGLLRNLSLSTDEATRLRQLLPTLPPDNIVTLPDLLDAIEASQNPGEELRFSIYHGERKRRGFRPIHRPAADSRVLAAIEKHNKQFEHFAL
jgi:hypothetical protein